MVIISACLAGVPCRYNGCSVPFHVSIPDSILPLCPEQAFGTSRPPMELRADRIVYQDGTDATEQLLHEIASCLNSLEISLVHCAVLKEYSPSCGATGIYDGSFSGKRIRGEGLFTRELKKRGIPVFSDEQLKDSSVYNDFLRCLGRTPL